MPFRNSKLQNKNMEIRPSYFCDPEVRPRDFFISNATTHDHLAGQISHNIGYKSAGGKYTRTSSSRNRITLSDVFVRPNDCPFGIPTYITFLLKECTSSTAGTRSVSELKRYAVSYLSSRARRIISTAMRTSTPFS